MNPDTPSTQQAQIDPQFFIAKYLLPVLEHKWIVLFTTLIGMSVAIPISFLINPEYSSTAHSSGSASSKNDFQGY
jgi:uncharacterized protein involved in exopolysaccharide biosynthesis